MSEKHGASCRTVGYGDTVGSSAAPLARRLTAAICLTLPLALCLVMAVLLQPTTMQASSMQAPGSPQEEARSRGEALGQPSGLTVDARIAGDSTIIYLLDPASGAEEQLAEEPFRALPLPMFERFITLSPNEQLVAYVTADDLGMRQSRLWLITTATGQRQLLATFEDNFWIAPLAWSPESTRLAFAKTSGTSPSGIELWILDVSSGEQTLVVSDPSFRPALFYGVPREVVRWSTDGASIVYTDYAADDGAKIEYEVDLASATIRRVHYPLTAQEQEQASILASLPCGVSQFSQNDPQWKNDVMQTCGTTIGQEGCALTSQAMVFRYYAIETSPRTLNQCAGTHACPLDWAWTSSNCSGGKATWNGSTGFSWSTMEGELNAGRPPVLRLTSSYNHFVVVVSGSGSSMGGYTINDAWDGQVKNLSAYSGWFLTGLRLHGGTPWCQTPATHLECRNNYCTRVDGVGSDQCSPEGSYCGAVDAAQHLAQSEYPTVQTGQQFTIWFEVRNTGNTTWRDSDGYGLENLNGVTLGAWGRQEIGADVPPGATKRWDIQMTAPASPGFYHTDWQLKHWGEVFGPYMFIDVTVVSPSVDAAEHLAQSEYPTLQTGQQFSIWFEVRNTGNTTWRDSDGYGLENLNGVTLGAWGRQEIGADVPPGATKRWDIQMTAPATPGFYHTDWQLKHWGEVFGPYMFIDVTVFAPLYAPSNLTATPVSQSQINLSWDSTSTDVSSFIIARSMTGSDPWTLIDWVDGNVRSYQETGIGCGITLYYKVMAYRSVDDRYSDYSNVDSATTIACHTVSTPTTPSGPSSGQTGQTLDYATGGSTDSQGHSVEYRFDWGDGSYSTWSSSGSAFHSWSSPNTYCVKAQARCSVDNSVVSSWSGCKDVPISSPPPEPDLVPAQGGDWEYPIVPSSTTGTTVVNTLYACGPTYVDWGIANSGTADCGADAYGDLYIDGTRLAHYNFGNVLAGWSWAFFDWTETVYTPGWHTLKVVADPGNLVEESDETNNSWERQFYWEPDKCVCVEDWHVSCGESHSWNNGDAGSTDQIESYSCWPYWEEAGPEYTYTFVPDVSGQVTVLLDYDWWEYDLDIFVVDDVEGSCSAGNCITYGDDTATFDAEAGHTYYLVVDGYSGDPDFGDVGDYTITVNCSAGPTLDHQTFLPLVLRGYAAGAMAQGAIAETRSALTASPIPKPTAIRTPTATPSATVTAAPMLTPTVVTTSTMTPTPTAASKATATPTSTHTPTHTGTPIPVPTAAPTEAVAPTPQPYPTPGETDNVEPG